MFGTHLNEMLIKRSGIVIRLGIDHIDSRNQLHLIPCKTLT
jgi:hypothetical protein